jgi:hypothetical protein
VAQYANSADYYETDQTDPFMVIVPSTKQFLDSYMICVPEGFSFNHINVVVPDGAEDTVEINGLGIPVPGDLIGDSTYRHARIALPGPGAYTVSAALPFGLTVYGFARYDSYGWPGGLFLGDVAPPAVTCLISNLTATVDEQTSPPCCSPVPDLRNKVRVSDNCPLTNVVVIQDPLPGTCVGPGTHTITLSVADASGNVGTCATTLTVIDATPPNIQCLHCPSNIVVQATPADCTAHNAPGVVVDYNAGGRPCCRTPQPPRCEPPPGSCFACGTTLVTCSVTNEFGNLNQCQFTVTVVCQVIRIQRSGSQVTLTWPEGGVLESATSVLGTWIPVANATSPYTVPIQPNERQRFFRVRN